MDEFIFVVVFLFSMFFWGALFALLPRFMIVMVFSSAILLLLVWKDLDNHKMDFLKRDAVITKAEITGREECMSGKALNIPTGTYETHIMYRDEQGRKYNKVMPCEMHGYYSLSGFDLIYNRDAPEDSVLRCDGCTNDISFVTVFSYDLLGCLYFVFGVIAMFAYALKKGKQSEVEDSEA